MIKSARKPLAILVALLMVLGTVPLFGFAASAADLQGITGNPLTVEITSNREFCSLFSTVTFKATIKNVSDNPVEFVSAEALFGADMTPLEAGEGEAFVAVKSALAPGASMTLTYKAQLNKLKSWDQILTPLMLLRDLFRKTNTVTLSDNGFDDGRDKTAPVTKAVNMFSLFAIKYDATTTVKVYYGNPATTEEFAKVSPEVEVLTQTQSEDFYKNAVPKTVYEDGSMLIENVPGGVDYDVGEIFMVLPSLDPANYNPLGVTGRVVSKDGDKMVIEEPSLGEVFTEMNIDLDGTFSGANIIGEYIYDDMDPGSGLGLTEVNTQSALQSAGPQANFNFSKLWDLDYTLYKDPGGNGDIKLGGRLGFDKVDISLDADFDIKNLKDTKVIADANIGLYADVHVKAQGSYNFGLKSKDPLLSQGLNIPYVGKFTFGGISTPNKIPLVRVIFDVGTMSFQTDVGGNWAPAMLAVSLELTTTLGGQVSGKLEMGVSYNAYVNGGFTFDNTAPNANQDKKFDWRGGISGDPLPKAYAEADGKFSGEARVGLDVAIYVLGCKLAAITNDFALFAEVDVQGGVSTDHPAQVAINARVAVKLLGEARFALKAKYDPPDWLSIIPSITVIDVDYRAPMYTLTIWEKDFGMRTQLWEPLKGGNGHVYTVLNEEMDWDKAKVAAEKLGGHLVTITSPAEQAFVEGLLDSNKLNREFYWIGACVEHVEQYNIYFNWVTSEPFDNFHAPRTYKWTRSVFKEATQTTPQEDWFEPNGNWTNTDGYVCIWKNSPVGKGYYTPNTWSDLPINGEGYTHGFICEIDT